VNATFPLRLDWRGRTAVSGWDDHVREMIEQLLFTAPGERVNRPEFGTGLLRLTFAPNSPELAATLQFAVQAAIEQWLGDIIQVEELEVASEEATLSIRLGYVARADGERRSLELESTGGPA
jgi:phage baseplate assembly protein W